jgi:protein-tyrosine phosphatase
MGGLGWEDCRAGSAEKEVPVGEPDWPGARNLRDLGGRALRDGGVTAPRRVFRSGAPEYLTDEGWRKAKAAGLRTVIDLRNAPAETGRAPDHPAIRPEAASGLVFVPAPTEDPGDAEFLRVCGPWLDHPRSWADNARLAPARITAVMRAIASAEGAVLVHCAGGRDRTGMICAMLLDLAGATADAIADDYADGWRGAGAYSGHGWAYDAGRQTWREQHQPPAEPEELRRQLAEREPGLREWIKAFDTGGYLASNRLADRETSTLKSLLRP